ncbi:MAG: P-loop NTPase [Deltaproteobacteria bacterium]|nr:P-loop NTPase [Deltaproteobacteria bacterium]MDZ4345385.1 P-loop NTPase [Candidatus Binatia bacterium]
MIETTATFDNLEWMPEPNRKPFPAAPAAAKVLGPAPVFAITSGKGGVGKTNVTANLAAALALKNRRVMVIDADLGLANLDLLLGVRPTYTLADFFAGAAPLDEIIVTNRHGILLLPGASGVQEMTSLSSDQKAALLTELDAITHELDIALVDTGSGISDAVTYFTAAAQEIVVVVTPEPASMTDAYALVKVLALAHRQKRFWILANSVSGEAEARRLFDALSRTALCFLNVALDYLGWIPRDPRLVRAVARSRMVVEDAGDAPSAQAFVAVAERLMQTAAGGVAVKGNLQFFLRRMVAGERGGR